MSYLSHRVVLKMDLTYVKLLRQCLAWDKHYKMFLVIVTFLSNIQYWGEGQNHIGDLLQMLENVRYFI